MKAFFHKLIHSTPLYVNGRVAPFIGVGDDEGVLATESEALIHGIRALIKQGVGAVREVTEAECEDAKKKPASDWLAKLQSPPEAVIMEVSKVYQSQPAQQDAQAPAAAASPEPTPAPKQRTSDVSVLRPKSRAIPKTT